MTARRALPHRLVVPIVALLAAAPVSLPAAAAADRVSKLIEKADRRFELNDYERGAELYARADRAANGESLPAVVGLARSSFFLFRFDDTIEAAERWIRMADSPEARTAGYNYLGLGLHGRGLTERWGPRQPNASAAGGHALSGDESLRASADAYRRAAAGLRDGGAGAEGITAVLLNLADTLVWIGERKEAAAVLDAYDTAGGGDPYAAELRCWAGGAVQKEADGTGGEDGEGEQGPAEAANLTWEVQPPVKIYAPAPRYPPSVRAARIESTVILQAILTKNGTLRCLRPVSGYPYQLVRSAMTTVRKWRFKPARLHGEPVDVYYNLTVNFDLRR